MKINRGKIVLILALMSISISILIYSFAYTTTNHYGDENSYLTVSKIAFGLTDSVESINLEQQTPTIDKFGLQNEPFSFSIQNTSSEEMQYMVRLIDKTLSTIANDEIRYQLTKNGVVGNVKTLSIDGTIDSGIVASGEVINYSIIVWLKYDAASSGGTWEKVVKVEAGTINIDVSGANEPVLLDNMIPVYYDNESAVWKKADKTNSNRDYQWYDYDGRMWANSVVVSETNRATYIDNEKTPVGTEIAMDDILMFYVWIPRFKYDLFASGDPTMINVAFEKGISSTGTMKCTIKNGEESCSGSGSLTHPAFSFNGEELSGFWVSKFELSPESSTTCYSYVATFNCNLGNLLVTSKPNQKSLVNISIGNLFKSIRSMELSENIYGFKNSGTVLNADGTIYGDNNDYDIHLAKSFESGALAYLTYSKYGKYGNSAYDENNKNIYVNNSSTKTGSSYVDGTTYEYNIDYYGTGASTTGTVYGVYDLNGYIYEYVMANVLDSSDKFYEYSTSASNFVTAPDSRYYDGYAYASNSSNFKNFYGDAVGEFVGFTSNTSAKPYYNYPFMARKTVDTVYFTRGGYSSTYGGRAVITVSPNAYITKW